MCMFSGINKVSRPGVRDVAIRVDLCAEPGKRTTLQRPAGPDFLSGALPHFWFALMSNRLHDFAHLKC